MGNYLFCSKCVHHALGISYRQRTIKQSDHNEPIRNMSKSEVEENRLSEYVLMPTECDLSFMEWWKTKIPDDEVQVRYPHSRHRNTGKSSNGAKRDAKSAFLEFIDCNSQPNGRSKESSSATPSYTSSYKEL